MSFFVKTNTTNDDPFTDALVSLSSDDPYTYVSISALRNSDIFTAINIIAGDLAGNPVLCDTPIFNTMINQTPNPSMSGYSLKYALAANMLLNGNAFAEIRGHDLIFIPNSQMTVTQDDVSGRLTYTYSPDGQTKRVITPGSILHFKYFTKDGVSGISPLFALRDEQQIQSASNQLLTGFFNSGIHGTKVVQVHKAELSKQAKDNIREQFDDATTGTNALGTMVIDDSMDVSNLELNTDVLKLVNSNDWTTRQIAECFQLPVERLGVENEHSNQEQSNLQYIQSSLQHYMDCMTSELSFKLGHQFAYNTDNLLSLDPEAQQKQAVNGFINGVLTRNEARAKIGLNPTDDGNIFVNINKNGAENSGENG
ncbi:phage portal protein [Lentilactobacillus parafarraginis]|uniref:Phage portal protein, HK97 family n=1 Tax=Lentilactobacillus parafarraginis DSM 18390 = JCM 14109 TaxID=1423786 RepID=A0A0R1YBW6_9LACO|nr:phage portal protein [Lentilactobacillus parafarraginis]KRM39885.1 phage portal protein, HK97 family [Lentilactobacillus parafarraginis DSM 18390 = JCM 14109]